MVRINIGNIGGTMYTIQFAHNMDKPVYIFSQDDKCWYSGSSDVDLVAKYTLEIIANTSKIDNIEIIQIYIIITKIFYTLIFFVVMRICEICLCVIKIS